MAETIHEQPNRVRYAMNGLGISLGSHVSELTDAAMRAARKIGQVSVDMGPTECKVPFAPDYIQKARARASKKRAAR